jgi:hypothetical protein
MTIIFLTKFNNTHINPLSKSYELFTIESCSFNSSPIRLKLWDWQNDFGSCKNAKLLSFKAAGTPIKETKVLLSFALRSKKSTNKRRLTIVWFYQHKSQKYLASKSENFNAFTGLHTNVLTLTCFWCFHNNDMLQI